MSDDSQEETGTVINPFEDVVNKNLEKAAIQKEKYIMKMIEAWMHRVEKLICNKVVTDEVVSDEDYRDTSMFARMMTDRRLGSK